MEVLKPPIPACAQMAPNLRRLFWSEDQRFLKQFKAGKLESRFRAFSKFPPCFKVPRRRRRLLPTHCLPDCQHPSSALVGVSPETHDPKRGLIPLTCISCRMSASGPTRTSQRTTCAR